MISPTSSSMVNWWTTFDSADLVTMEQKGTLVDVITHEMGHVLGIGTIWQDVGLLDGHWRESIFRNELMTGFVSTPGNPLSRITVASLADLGYQVDLDAADPYELPDLFAIAESGELVPHTAPIDDGIMLPILPLVLPRSSLPG